MASYSSSTLNLLYFFFKLREHFNSYTFVICINSRPRQCGVKHKEVQVLTSGFLVKKMFSTNIYTLDQLLLHY